MRKKPWRKWRQRRVGETWRWGTGGRKGVERCKGEKTVRCTIRELQDIGLVGIKEDV